VVGLAFKQGTDDLRESPAVDLVRKLLDAGMIVEVYDPQIEPKNLIGQNLGYSRAILPGIDDILIDASSAQSGNYDRIIATNRLVDTLDLDADLIIDLSTIV